MTHRTDKPKGPPKPHFLDRLRAGVFSVLALTAATGMTGCDGGDSEGKDSVTVVEEGGDSTETETGSMETDGSEDMETTAEDSTGEPLPDLPEGDTTTDDSSDTTMDGETGTDTTDGGTDTEGGSMEIMYETFDWGCIDGVDCISNGLPNEEWPDNPTYDGIYTASMTVKNADIEMLKTVVKIEKTSNSGSAPEIVGINLDENNPEMVLVQYRTSNVSQKIKFILGEIILERDFL